MNISIGDKNKIKQSTIGNNNTEQNEKISFYNLKNNEETKQIKYYTISELKEIMNIL